MASSDALLSGAAAVLVLLQVSLLPSSAVESSTPISAGDILHICRRSDPKLGECIRQSMQELLPKLAKGIPELKISPHEPLKISELVMKQGQGSVSIDSTFTNQIVNGISNMEFLHAKADMDKNEIMVEFKTPFLFIEGNYSMHGRILLVPIKGQGYGRTNYSVVTGTITMRGHRQQRRGREYLEPDSMAVDTHVKKAKIVLDNLFNGDKLLGETLGRVLEENWELLFNELKPLVDESIGLLLLDTARRVFQRFPLDDLLPPQ